MSFLVDNQLRAALARFLASRGVACRHVLDVGMGSAADSEIWEYASRNDCVVISKDEDFLYLANMAGSKARFVWIRMGNCRTKALLNVMDELWPQIEGALRSGERVVEVR